MIDQVLQGVPTPGWKAAKGAEPGARPRAIAGQVLVPEQAHTDEGKLYYNTTYIVPDSMT